MAAFELNAGENLQFEFNLLSMEEGLVFKGAWSALILYVVDDVVTLSGIAYKCILGHINQTPPNVTYWVVLPGVAATDVREILAQLQPMGDDTSVVEWKFKHSQPPPSNVKLTDGLLQLELLKKDTVALVGHYDLVVELTTKSSLYIASGAQTDVATVVDVVNVSQGQSPPPA